MTIDIKELGKITASKEVLNKISIAFNEASYSYLSRNRDELANYCSRVSDVIYYELD